MKLCSRSKTTIYHMLKNIFTDYVACLFQGQLLSAKDKGRVGGRGVSILLLHLAVTVALYKHIHPCRMSM